MGVVKSFAFCGEIPASKSLMNRALICASYGQGLKVLGSSSCDDVQKMRSGLVQLNGGGPMDCGSAGTTFRFLTLRASRNPGEHKLFGSERLFSRPQEGLFQLLDQLGVELVSKEKTSVSMFSRGWREPPSPIVVDRHQSSQFASGVLINCWNLEFPIEITWGREIVSDGYWRMSVELVKKMGMNLMETDEKVVIPAHQEVQKNAVFNVECDLSSAFAVVALGLVGGSAKILNFPTQSLQPDREFIEILSAMGANINFEGSTLNVHKTDELSGINWNLVNCPDLFPVLSVICALAEGKSVLSGATHLVHKESDRLKKSAELVAAMGRKVEMRKDGMCIFGSRLREFDQLPNLIYDTDQDHRLAFAASVAQMVGMNIEILGKDVVNKSFPEFWSVVEKGVALGRQ